MDADYTTVTELPGNKASSEQIARLFHRYRFASDFCKNKDILEVACGAGIGLGLLAKVASTIVAGDIDKKNLQLAQETYEGRLNIEIHQLDAINLPFEDKQFDVVILYEAIYYLSQPELFVSESHRVLRPGGMLLLCTVNKDWQDFNPSPFSTRYFSIPELFLMLSEKFTRISFYGAFPTSTNTLKDSLISLIKRTAIALHLMPKTMKGKEFFKRIFFGQLVPVPNDITNITIEYRPPVSISPDSPNSLYKVIYAVAQA